MEGAAPQAESSFATTAQLLAQVRAGDPVARAEILLRYREPLVRFVHGRLSPSARGVIDPDDVVQEVLAVALQRLEYFEYRGLGSFWGYLRRIGINQILSQARRGPPGASSVEAGEIGKAASASPPSELVRREAMQALEEALELVEEPLRGALLLRLELGLPYETVARECGYPSADAVRMAIGRCMARLARELAAFEP